MLLFCTTLPLKAEATQRDCVSLYSQWVCQSRYYPIDAIDVDAAMTGGYEFREGNFAFLITHYRDEKATVSACRLENAQTDKLWLSDCVYVEDAQGKRVHIQVKCNRFDFSAAAPDVHTPNIVRRFIDQGLCRDDDWMPVTSSPLYATKDNVEQVAAFMRGEGRNAMPVVYLSTDGWGWALDPEKTAWNMTGLAHVVVEQEPMVALQLMDLTHGNNAHRGYAAIYMPHSASRYLFNAANYPSPGALNHAIRRTLLQGLVNSWDSSDFGWEQLRLKQNRQRMLEQAASHTQKANEWEELFSSIDAEMAEKDTTIEQLRAQLDIATAKLSALESIPDKQKNEGFFSRGEEPEYIEGEYVDLLRNVLTRCRDKYPENSRPVMLIDSMLNANAPVGGCARTLKIIKDVLGEKGELNSSNRSTLRQLGFLFETEHDSHGHEISYFRDPRFRISFACSPSSCRGGNNTFTRIRNMLDVERNI